MRTTDERILIGVLKVYKRYSSYQLPPLSMTRRKRDVQKETKSKKPMKPQARIVQDLKKWKGKRGFVAANRS